MLIKEVYKQIAHISLVLHTSVKSHQPISINKKLL